MRDRPWPAREWRVQIDHRGHRARPYLRGEEVSIRCGNRSQKRNVGCVVLLSRAPFSRCRALEMNHHRTCPCSPPLNGQRALSNDARAVAVLLPLPSFQASNASSADLLARRRTFLLYAGKQGADDEPTPVLRSESSLTGEVFAYFFSGIHIRRGAKIRYLLR